jgi:hypothetical protein
MRKSTDFKAPKLDENGCGGERGRGKKGKRL